MEDLKTCIAGHDTVLTCVSVFEYILCLRFLFVYIQVNKLYFICELCDNFLQVSHKFKKRWSTCRVTVPATFNKLKPDQEKLRENCEGSYIFVWPVL